jgi:gp16 family phage-associated protein
MKQKPKPLKTADQVRAEFDRKGLSVAEWARRHDVSRSLVYEILSGRRTAFRRGDTHRVAVLLGLKHGEIVSAPESVNAQPLDRAA